MKKVLISKCLLGENVRFDGGNCKLESNNLEFLNEAFELISICPEVMAGMSIPRIPIEICDGEIIRKDGKNVTSEFSFVKSQISELLSENEISFAILKDFSPSCGSENIYDGSFSGETIKGKGIITKYLNSLNIDVFHEKNFMGKN